MGFIGRLEEMPLQDIVQILAMSKRTGRLNLTKGPTKGVIAFRQGQVICAVSDSCRVTLGQLLVQKGHISDDTLASALRIQKHRMPWRLHGSLLVDMGAISKQTLDETIRVQIETVIGELLTWEAGVFKFEPMTEEELLAEEFGGAGLVLRDGVSTAQTVLEALRLIDEARSDSQEDDSEGALRPAQPVPFPVARRSKPALEKVAEVHQTDGQAALAALPDSDRIDELFQEVSTRHSGGATEFELVSSLLDLNIGDSIEGLEGSMVKPIDDPTDIALVKSIMDEIRSPQFTGEISLMIMRYASAIAQRGVFFAVRSQGVTILGEFGVRWANAELRKRHQKEPIPLDRITSFNEVIESRRTYKGRMSEARANRGLLELFNGAVPSEFIAVPMIVEGVVMAILYCDNSPDGGAIGSIECLELLMIHGGLCIEKNRLELRMKS